MPCGSVSRAAYSVALASPERAREGAKSRRKPPSHRGPPLALPCTVRNQARGPARTQGSRSDKGVATGTEHHGATSQATLSQGGQWEVAAVGGGGAGGRTPPFVRWFPLGPHGSGHLSASPTVVIWGGAPVLVTGSVFPARNPESSVTSYCLDFNLGPPRSSAERDALGGPVLQ